MPLRKESPKENMDWKIFSQIYDDLYDRGIQVFTEHNLCDVRDGECKSYRINKNRGNFCCKGCPHLGEMGCMVKALYCKLWICQELIYDLPDGVMGQLADLYDEALELNMLRFRASKEETFERGNSSRWMVNRYREILTKRGQCEHSTSFYSPIPLSRQRPSGHHCQG